MNCHTEGARPIEVAASVEGHTPLTFPSRPAPPSACYEQVFTDQELDTLEAYCSELCSNRDTQYQPHDHQTAWIYSRVAEIAQTLNDRCFHFDLWGIAEPIQYKLYDGEGSEVTFMDWHVDSDVPDFRWPPRKLTFSIQLSQPDYEGGELEVWGTGGWQTFEKKRGLMAMFPAYTLHRVTPVTKGTRKVLIGWVSGPQFR